MNSIKVLKYRYTCVSSKPNKNNKNQDFREQSSNHLAGTLVFAKQPELNKPIHPSLQEKSKDLTPKFSEHVVTTNLNIDHLLCPRQVDMSRMFVLTGLVGGKSPLTWTP